MKKYRKIKNAQDIHDIGVKYDKNNNTTGIMNDSYCDTTNKYLSKINDILTIINETCVH